MYFLLAILFTPVQDYKFSITNSQQFVIVNNQGGTLPKFLDVPVKYSRMSEKSVLADIMNRTDQPSTGSGRATDGHESTHRLNAQLRNEHGGACFYVLDGKAGYCKEPAFRKREVIAFVPNSLREGRFRTYVTGASDWDDKPSYIAEEWSAYINDTAINLEDRGNGMHTDQADCAMGALEMGIYSVALCMAVEKLAPDSWANDSQFKAIMRYQWKRAKELYDKAAPLWPFSAQDALLNNLRTSPDAEAMRQFINTHFDGVWLKP